MRPTIAFIFKMYLFLFILPKIKRAWFRHVTYHNGLSKKHPSGHLGVWRTPWSERKCWTDNVKEWTSLSMPELLTMASRRKDRKKISDESSLLSLPPHPPPPNLTTQSVIGLHRAVYKQACLYTRPTIYTVSCVLKRRSYHNLLCVLISLGIVAFHAYYGA